MANFINAKINQTVLIDINYLESLGNDSFDYYFYCLPDKIDILSDFLSRYKNNKVGRKAYPGLW